MTLFYAVSTSAFMGARRNIIREEHSEIKHQYNSIKEV